MSAQEICETSAIDPAIDPARQDEDKTFVDLMEGSLSPLLTPEEEADLLEELGRSPLPAL
jgi:hypothetical protein